MKRESIVRGVTILAIVFVFTGLAPADPRPERQVKTPQPTVTAKRAVVPAEYAEALADLGRAKRDGDVASVERIHAQLGWGDAPVAASSAGVRVVYRDYPAQDPSKWGGDVLVNYPQWSSGYPDMTCGGDGTFYVVVVDLDAEDMLDLYRSDDGGASWSYEYSLFSADGPIYFPSIAIGEGVHNRLLIAYETDRNGAAAKVVVFWRDLDTFDSDSVTIETHPNSIVGRPRICVDSPEHTVWYAYLTYARGSSGAFDYDMVFTRSLDYGTSWETPGTFSSTMRYDDGHDLDYGAAGLFVAYTHMDTSIDIITRYSDTFGMNWTETVLAGTSFDEYGPSVAVSNTGQTVVVAYTVDYTHPDTDVEARVTDDGANTWDHVYLPYNFDPESHSRLTCDPSTDTIHAAFMRDRGVVTTHAAQATPLVWSPPLRVNEQQSAVPFWGLAIAADPTGAHGVGVAWWDTRVPDKYGVYFDQANEVHPRAVEYLMICPDALIDPAAALAHYRELRGYGVHLVTLSQIGPAPLSAVDIDIFIEDYALAAPQLRFLALVGDVDLLPGFYVDDGSDQWYSDLIYADIDSSFDSDYMPDIAVGRIPVSEAGEMWDYVAKVKAFEMGFAERNKVLFFGDQAEMSYVANRDSLAISDTGYIVDTLYDPTEPQLLAALNDSSLAMVLYYGHGSFANNWPLHLGNLDSWTNADDPVLYFSGGCNFNDNTIASPPLGHELLFSAGCAAASTGATLYGGYGYSYEYIHILLGDSWLYRTMGELHRHALIEHHDVAAAAGQDVSLGSWVRFFTERMMCHGDPALRIDGDVTAVGGVPPAGQYLAQNYPNPFNPQTTIAFDLPAEQVVSLWVYDVSGRLVRVLVDGEIIAEGRNEATWNGRDDAGRRVASGTYFYRLKAGAYAETKRMALIK